jgi:hypothetical protein
MVLINVDFYGSDEELEKLDKAYKKMAEKTEGVEYKGRLVPMQTKWHFTYVFKAENMKAWAAGNENFKYDRDRKVMSHGAVEFYM